MAPLRTLAMAALLVLLAAPAQAGWGARGKEKPTATSRRGERGTRARRGKRTRGSKRTRRSKRGARGRAANTPKTPLSERVDALLRSGRKLQVGRALPLIREAVAGRDMGLAVRVADAVAGARRVTADQLAEAARALGRSQQLPIQLTLWARAYKLRAPSWVKQRVAEGYVDALLAAGRTEQARKVIGRALRITRVGMRRGLLERLVAWGKLTGDLDEVRDTLLSRQDPDATVLAARLITEMEGDDEGLEVLRRGWRRFAGHRGVQAH